MRLNFRFTGTSASNLSYFSILSSAHAHIYNPTRTRIVRKGMLIWFISLKIFRLISLRRLIQARPRAMLSAPTVRDGRDAVDVRVVDERLSRHPSRANTTTYDCNQLRKDHR